MPRSSARLFIARHTVLGRAFAVTLLALSCTGCVIVSGSVNPFASQAKPLVEHRVGGRGSARIVLLEINGEITSESRDSAFGLQLRESTVSRVEAALTKARDDRRVAAVILRINSPGGTVTASDVVYDLVKRFRRERNVPVVAEILDVGASGGYYVALAADEIVAHPTSIVGSVGVVMQSVSFSGLMEKVGVRNQSIVTGDKKQIGSPLTEMTDAERAVLQRVVDDMYERFLALVRENRPRLTEEADRLLQDGRIFSAPQALAGGLVDRVEYLEDTIENVVRRTGIGEATVVVYRQPNDHVRGIYSHAQDVAPQVNLINIDAGIQPATPRLLYLWTP